MLDAWPNSSRGSDWLSMAIDCPFFFHLSRDGPNMPSHATDYRWLLIVASFSHLSRGAHNMPSLPRPRLIHHDTLQKMLIL